MAGPRPDDNYNPVPEVAPQTGMPSDTLSVRASAENFGGQVGAAVKQTGQTLEQGENDAFTVAMQRQGIANEHAAQAADLQLGIQGGERYSKFKDLEGLDAANSKGAFVKDYSNLYEKIGASLNPAARRAYDQVATRRMLFTIQEANDYASDQTKKAYRAGNAASNNLAAQEAAQYEVASNPGALGARVGTVIFNTNTNFTAPDYGTHQTIPSTTDPKTGKLLFDTSTSQGKNAQAEYDNALAIETDKIYTNASDIIMVGDKDHPGNVSKAVDFLKENFDAGRMSPGTYYHQMAKFSGPYANEQAHQDVSQTIGEYTHNYQYGNGVATIPSSYIPKQITSLIPGAVVTSTLRTPEHNKEVGGVDTSLHLSGQAADIVLPLGTTAADLKAKLDAQGIKTTEFLDEGTHIHVGWGAKGQATPVGVTPTIAGGTHISLPDYLGSQLPQIMQAARQRAADRGGDQTAQDKAAALAETQVNQLRSGQAGEVRTLRAQLLQKIMDPNHPITSPTALDYADPETRDMWTRYQTLDIYGANAMQRIISANAMGKSSTFGTDFYSHYADQLSGKIKNVADLQDYFGNDKYPISTEGVKILSKTAEAMETPEGQAFAHAEKGFLDHMRGLVLGTAIYPGADPTLNKESFDKQLMAKIPQIEAKKADLVRQRKDPMEMFDPKSKEYIGNDIKAITPDQLNKAIGTKSLVDMANGRQAPAPVTTAANIPKNNTFDTSHFKNVDDVGLAMQRGDITPDQAHKLVAERFGGFAPGIPTTDLKADH